MATVCSFGTDLWRTWGPQMMSSWGGNDFTAADAWLEFGVQIMSHFGLPGYAPRCISKNFGKPDLQRMDAAGISRSRNQVSHYYVRSMKWIRHCAGCEGYIQPPRCKSIQCRIWLYRVYDVYNMTQQARRRKCQALGGRGAAATQQRQHCQQSHAKKNIYIYIFIII